MKKLELQPKDIKVHESFTNLIINNMITTVLGPFLSPGTVVVNKLGECQIY